MSLVKRRKQSCHTSFELLEQRRLMSGTFHNFNSLALPDLTRVNSLIQVVGQSGRISDVDVLLSITHNHVQDLDVYLISDRGTRVKLFTDVGGTGKNFAGTILDDEAAKNIASESAPFSGRFRPEGSLAEFDGEDPNGIWKLEVRDDRRGTTGTLFGWSLILTTQGTDSGSNNGNSSGGSNNSGNNGSGAAGGIFNENAGQPVNTPLRGDPNNRNADLYNRVIDQFQVATNPRYSVRDLNRDGQLDTFCNIFAWDVTRAMGAQIPHWVDSNSRPAEPSVHNRELSANATVDWMRLNAHTIGWRQLTDANPGAEAQRLAKLGHPVVAMWKNPAAGQSGHMMVVRPGEWSQSAGATIAQAGGKPVNGVLVSNNFNVGHIFTHTNLTSESNISYWVNDRGTVQQQQLPGPIAPSAPRNLNFTRTGPGVINLVWEDTSSNETGFRLQWWDGSRWSTYHTVGRNATNSATVLTVGHTYRLRVAAFNAQGEAASNEISVRG